MASLSPGTLTFDSISDTMPNAINSFETEIERLMEIENPTSVDLFAMQKSITEWSLASSTISTVLKTLSDTLKGTLQKIN
jgi:Type III secretion needle MxiH, YscF, SsaG, EprI, PscF, EscF